MKLIDILVLRLSSVFDITNSVVDFTCNFKTIARAEKKSNARAKKSKISREFLKLLKIQLQARKSQVESCEDAWPKIEIWRNRGVL